jgi:hypothetical protein
MSFKAKYGHCDVSTCGEDASLGKGCSQLRVTISNSIKKLKRMMVNDRPATNIVPSTNVALINSDKVEPSLVHTSASIPNINISTPTPASFRTPDLMVSSTPPDEEACPDLDLLSIRDLEALLLQDIERHIFRDSLVPNGKRVQEDILVHSSLQETMPFAQCPELSRN